MLIDFFFECLPLIGSLVSFTTRLILSYLACFNAIVLIRVLHKLRYEVFNSDLKDSPSKDQVVLITGATSGFGLSMARHFHKRGYSVIAGHRSILSKEYKELIELNHDKKCRNYIYSVDIDVQSEDSIKAAYEVVKRILEDNRLHLRALINNAGLMKMQKAQWIRTIDLRSLIDTNLVGPMLMVKHFWPLLVKGHNARIVNICSIACFTPGPILSVYGATKQALAFYGSSLSYDKRDYGVQTVTLYAGALFRNTRIVRITEEDIDKTYNEFSDDLKELDGERFKRFMTGENELLDRLQWRIREAQTGESKIVENKQRSNSSNLTKYLRDLCATIFGGLSPGTDLTNPSFLQNFDNSVSLRSPPKEMFAGNAFYNIVTSSIIESTSHGLRRFICSIYGTYPRLVELVM